MTADETKDRNIKTLLLFVVLAVGIVYYFSNPKPQEFYDYTFRVAENVLRGEIGFKEKPPSWLNEFVPFEGNWYSVFPLGSVVTMMAFAVFKVAGVFQTMPAALISAITASLICWFLLKISERYALAFEKKLLFTLVILFGTWMWTNETIGGAWQLALGWSMVGELGAIYFTVYNRKPLLAGLFFALAFGNRTEVLLTAPIFMFLLFYDKKPDGQITEESEIVEENETSKPKKKKKSKAKTGNISKEKNENSYFEQLGPAISDFKSNMIRNPQSAVRNLVSFCAVPFVLGVSTLVYNKIRFNSFTDFGYARIPGVLNEPWYNHGIFSVYYIPGQAIEMLWKPWEVLQKFPYLAPDPFSSSILWSSPFLFLLFRKGARDKVLVFCAWLAIFVLTIILWMHGNSGGWQFGYRYAMVLLPWIFVILLENSPKKITVLEAATCTFSFLINIYSIWLFHWTEYMKR